MTACEHLVQFYGSEDELTSAVLPYLTAGLEADDAVLVIATAAHRLAFERELATAGVGLEEAIAAGTYVVVDATEILRYLQDDGSGEIAAPDFHATVGSLVQRLIGGGRRLRVYGEIVSLLWDRGEVSAALMLEELWSDLQSRHGFSLCCGYPVVPASAQLAAVPDVCLAHSFVLPALADDPPVERWSSSVEFTPDLEAPRRVRALLGSMLAELEFDEDLAERLTLAASELAANAVVHARTPFRLLLQPRPESVWVGVEDQEPMRDPWSVVGRTPHGLGLIAALALRWGVTPGESGKTVWAEIPQRGAQ
jgi:anti-sigma regulatory factor (Ser/Thr protein kinase)